MMNKMITEQMTIFVRQLHTHSEDIWGLYFFLVVARKKMEALKARRHVYIYIYIPLEVSTLDLIVLQMGWLHLWLLPNTIHHKGRKRYINDVKHSNLNTCVSPILPLLLLRLGNYNDLK